MKVIHRTIQREGRDGVYRVWCLSDWHIGSVFCDETRLRKDIQRIADDPYAFWVGGGDYGEFINRSDKRHRESNLADWLHGEDDIASLQCAKIAQLVQPIAGKCLALAKGNHEDAILEKYERDVYQNLVDCVKSDFPICLGYGGFLVLRWEFRDRITDTGGPRDAWETTGFIHHGNGGGFTMGGAALSLERLPQSYDLDFALLGHKHLRLAVPNEQWIARGAKVICRRQIMCYGGTYLAPFDAKLDTENYAERRMLKPRAVGCVVLEFRPATREIKAIL
jgi:hypothetical protein